MFVYKLVDSPVWENAEKTIVLGPEQRKWRPTSAIPSINKYTKQQNIILQVIDDGYEKHVESGGAHSHHCEHKNAFWMIDTKYVLPPLFTQKNMYLLLSFNVTIMHFALPRFAIPL